MSAVAVYDVVIAHHRYVPPQRSFRHRLHTWLVDLDDLPRLPRPLRVLARFEARDHLGDPHRTIRQNLDHWLALHGIDLRGGRVLMLAHPRTLGYVFNPITVYWCHGPGGDLVCLVAEVCNTYGERHCYLLRPGADGISHTDKQLHVSPFLPNRAHYRMRLQLPEERLRMHIDLVQDGRTLLTATMTGRRLAATPAQLMRTALRRPLVPQRVAALIRRHGIALWVRRTPRVRRHPHVHQKGVR